MHSHYIKEWRKFRGMTQLTLARAADMERSYLSMVETGARQYNEEMILRLAKVLDTSPANLVGRHPDRDGIDTLLETVSESERVKIAAVVRAMLPPNETN